MEEFPNYIYLFHFERQEKKGADEDKAVYPVKNRTELRREINQAAYNGALNIVIQTPVSFDVDTAIVTDCLKHAARKKIPHRGIETPGLLESVPQNVKVLKSAGLTYAVISLGMDEKPDFPNNNFISVDHLDTSFIGARNLIESGININFEIWVTRRYLHLLAPLIEKIVSNFGSDHEIILSLMDMDMDITEEQSYSYLLLDQILESLIKKEKLKLRIDQRWSPAPCLLPSCFEYFDLPHDIYYRSPTKITPVRVCGECLFSPSCPGLNKSYIQAHKNTIKPFLTLNPEAEKTYCEKLIKANLFLTRYKYEVKVGELEQILIRTNYNCNERCLFCWVDPDLGSVPHRIVEIALKKIIWELNSNSIIVFTGGEPTLNPQLPDYIKTVSDAGIKNIELQTNAIRMADPEYAGQLVANGLTFALISLHGHTSEISDSITQTPGAFKKTIAGAKNLYDSGVRIQFNFVINTENYFTIPSYLGFIGDKFPDSTVILSIIGPKFAQEL
ncbi:MAG: radical SAM protein, partial [bacterium]